MLTAEPKRLKVVSLLPSATEVLCAIAGGEELLVGRSHEDDWPPQVVDRPILTGQKTTFTTSADVDRQVAESLSEGKSLYTLDEKLLEELAPDVILTQDLCSVCAIDIDTVEKVVQAINNASNECSLASRPSAPTAFPKSKIVCLNPRSIEQVLDTLITVGQAVNLEKEAHLARKAFQDRIDYVTGIAQGELRKEAEAGGIPPEDLIVQKRKKGVLFVEWTDPMYPGGHWVSQMIYMAGAHHPLVETLKALGYSKRVMDDYIMALDPPPEYVVICPCGLELKMAKREVVLLNGEDPDVDSKDSKDGEDGEEGKPKREPKEWWVHSVKHAKKVAILDGSHMFNRPGPRLVDALEWLVGWLWDKPELIPADFPWEEHPVPSSS
ncbi:hypothetical protein HK102_010524 [Quaeritorhiza haematococci]|nr:hypothetical protein HK102_010524 [Quaeritorhiza haematococci]